ncbi:MAG: hypothetical protein CMJ89_02955 [Planctomycetes bacterium]|nr:hypothetical protein [Planctomycetota bacterium]
MKLLFQAPFLSTLLIALASCASVGTDQASSTVSDLKKLQKGLAEGRQAITAAVTTLNQLAADDVDMVAEYKAFAQAVDRLKSKSKSVSSTNERLVSRREAFVASWAKGLAGIQNASMKERATKRHNAMVEKFDYLNSISEKSRSDYNQWFNDIVDVRKYLEFDLNPGGIASVKTYIKSVDKGAGKINQDLDEISSELGQLITNLEATKPPAETGTAAGK